MKSSSIAFLIFVILFITGIFLVSSLKPSVNVGVVKCIASKSTLYISNGCSACAYQESLFKDTFKYLKTVDCAKESERCTDLIGVPTWEINGEKRAGARTIEELKELTGC